jgi:hypothetical protein
MDVLVEKPGEQFTTTALVQRLGISRNSLRSTLSALTRHVRAHYGRDNWPFQFTWGPRLGEGSGAEGHYAVVDENVVAAWKKLRKQS